MYAMHAKPLLNLLGDRLHALPLVILYLTDGCNSRCVSCDIWRNVRRDMPLEIVRQVAAESAQLGLRWVLLSGGEAMQHPEWASAAEILRETGCHVMLLTNGLLLRKQADIVAGAVDEVIVSLDAGTAETYQAVRGVDGFDLVLRGIEAMHDRGIPVVTRTTVQRANFREMPLIIDVAQEAGASSISFLAVDVTSSEAFGGRSVAASAVPAQSPLALNRDEISEFEDILTAIEQRFAGAFASGLMAETPQKLRRLVTHFRALAGDVAPLRPRCNAPHFSVVIEVDGRLRPCYFLPASENLEGRTLLEAVNGQTARSLRQAYRTGQRQECSGCVCPLYKGPRGLLRM